MRTAYYYCIDRFSGLGLVDAEIRKPLSACIYSFATKNRGMQQGFLPADHGHAQRPVTKHLKGLLKKHGRLLFFLLLYSEME